MPEEAIREGILTPAHLQVIGSRPETLPKPHTITPSKDTPIRSKRKRFLLPNPQNVSSLSLYLKDSVHSVGPQESLNLLQEPKRDINLPFESLKDSANNGMTNQPGPMADTVHGGMQTQRTDINIKGKVNPSSPLLTPDNEHDEGNSRNSNSLKRSVTVHKRHPSSMEKLSNVHESGFPLINSPPSDSSNSTLQLGTTTDTEQDLNSTLEYDPTDTSTSDVSEVVFGCGESSMLVFGCGEDSMLVFGCGEGSMLVFGCGEGSMLVFGCGSTNGVVGWARP